MILLDWKDGKVPKDWRDATMIPIYKGKGAWKLCGNYRGIALSLAGKILAFVILRLN